MYKVVIYTDGACSCNPGMGGWGAILMCEQKQLYKEISGFDADTTNNRMEITAAIEALKQLLNPCEVEIHSDSAYLVNAFNQHWIKNWLKNDWKKSDKKPVDNRDLWEELLALVEIYPTKWVKTKGHANDPYNNRCDELARGEIERNRQEYEK